MHACIVAMNVGSVVSYLLILTDTVSGVAGAWGSRCGRLGGVDWAQEAALPRGTW